MNASAHIEIVDLRHFRGRQLRPLLEQEAVVWENRLRWSYAQSKDLLMEYLDSQILPGFVALRQGRVCGFCFCVYEGNKAVIGDIFVSPAEPARQAILDTLTRHLLEVLGASPGVDRIEAQLLLYDSGVLTGSFRPSGFRVYPRLFLECDLLAAPHASAPAAALRTGIELCAWHSTFYQPTAELIHAAYLGHLDSQINDQYRTLHGSLRFLHNIVRFPGCGVFQPEFSSALRDRATGRLVGVLLCSEVAPGVAHVTQLCVAPAQRGAGLGKRLLAHCTERLRTRGFRALTLTVSEANYSAVSLYHRAGFKTRLRFEALVLDKTLAQGSFRLDLNQPPSDESEQAAPSAAGEGASRVSERARCADGARFALARRRAIPGRS